MTKRILVAGGAGFVGTNLTAQLLKRGNTVVVLDNLQTGLEANTAQFRSRYGNRFSFKRGDVKGDVMGLGAFDEIYNLACPASPVHYQADPIDTLMTSVDGTRNLLQLAGQSGARFLMASTSEIYGDPECHPQTESYFGHVNPNGPRSCYDEGKRAAETLCCSYQAVGLDIRIARIFNTYGPYMRFDDGRIISNAICQALNGREITVYGDGTQTRSFCFVDDLVSGLIKLMESPAAIPGPVNLGNPTEMSINEIVASIGRFMGKRLQVTHLPLPVDDPRRRCPDISRAKSLLGWSPVVGLEEGIGKTVDWFRGEGQEPDTFKHPVTTVRGAALPQARI